MSKSKPVKRRGEFIPIPGGSKSEDKLHTAERRIRRLERAVESLLRDRHWNPNFLEYLRE